MSSLAQKIQVLELHSRHTQYCQVSGPAGLSCSIQKGTREPCWSWPRNIAGLTIRHQTAALAIRRKKPTRDNVKECDGRSYVRGSSEIANLHTRRERHPADAEELHLRSEGVRRRTLAGSNPDAVVSCFEDSKQRYDTGNLKVRRRILLCESGLKFFSTRSLKRP